MQPQQPQPPKDKDGSRKGAHASQTSTALVAAFAESPPSPLSPRVVRTGAGAGTGVGGNASGAEWAQAGAMWACVQASKFDGVMSALTRVIDHDRNPAAVDWCMDVSLRVGVVPVLYKAARNAMKWTKWGRVPTTDELTSGLMLCLLLLLRVAQDVQACVSDMGRADRVFVFKSFHDKVASWLLPWGQDTLSRALPSAVARLQSWLVAREAADEPWPSPAWATAFSVPVLLGTTFTFGTPAAEDAAAFARCRTLGVTRCEVAARMHALAASALDFSAMMDGLTTLLVAG